MDPEEFRKRGKEVVDWIADYYASLDTVRVLPDVQPGYLAKRLPDQAPQEAESFDAIMADVNAHIVPGMTHWQSPHFHAFFPSVVSLPSILGDMFSSAFGVVGFAWVCSPACTELETIVMDWLAKMLSLPDLYLSRGLGGGVIQCTASDSVFVCILAAREQARHRKPDDGESFSAFDARLVLYASDQVHSSVMKAAKLLSIRARSLTTSPDDHYGLRASTLEAAIAEDRAAGLIPFFLAATVGSTGCTAVDRVEELSLVTQREKLWLHIDAAYAGSSCICPEFRPLINGVENAQSFNFNPHKWLHVGFDCSALWVSDRNALHNALNMAPMDVMRNRPSESGLVLDYKDWQLPLGRRFRALKLWMVLRSFGVKGLQETIRNDCRMAALFEELVRADDRFEVPLPRQFAMVCFRLKGGEASNDINKALEDAVNAVGRQFFVHVALSGVYTLRFSVCNCKEEHIRSDWKEIQQIATQLLAKQPAA